MIVWDLREEMMYNMGANIMVDVIKQSIITINRGKPSPEITPLLSQYKDKGQWSFWNEITLLKMLPTSSGGGVILSLCV